MKITFLGHSGFTLEESQSTLLIDPWLTGNPVADTGLDSLNPSLILVTHGHADHLGDAIEISKRFGAEILGVFELANYCSHKGAKTIGANPGGKIKFDFGWVKLVPAIHSSSFEDYYLGSAVGFLINFYGNLIYHAGDTSLTREMITLGELYQINLAMLPIGGHFVMDCEDALTAIKWIKPQIVIPMHYNTFELLAQDEQKFKKEVESQTTSKCRLLNPGETLSL